jgi:Mg2+-importing ATPase
MTIIGILVLSTALGFWQELRAHVAIAELLNQIAATSSVLRDGTWHELPSSQLVPGDIVRLSAGSQIPADCRVLESMDLAVDESCLTGESFPCDKQPGTFPAEPQREQLHNAVFMGSHVLSGEATVVVCSTGSRSTYGVIAAHVQQLQPATEFELGIRRLGYFMLEVAATLSLIVLVINLSYGRPGLDALLFTLALLVGMTPQLLPAIVTATLAQGAHTMAQKKAIVRRLTSIADLGGISVLCTDKTGTLTEGVVRWERSLAFDGSDSEQTALYAHLNALHETGFSNPIDDALRAVSIRGANNYNKLDEIPYDFSRRMLSVLVQSGADRIMVTKGAFNEVIAACSHAVVGAGGVVPIGEVRERCEDLFHTQSRAGCRCLGVAYKPLGNDELLSRSSESEMIFCGLVTFTDPPLSTAITSVQALEAHGITCKMVTGDNRFVAAKVAADLGVLDPHSMMTGAELDTLNSEALSQAARDIDIFAEVNPIQKERIIRALKQIGAGVGYLGDGINDAAALRSADVGISVDTATSVTKEAADILLLDKDLGVLLDAVQEGRRAFANTLKYILVTTSANFGNMFSVAGASLFADFLPMLPKQILLLNILSDLPAMALAADRVDPEMIRRPLRWSTRSVGVSMAVYGLISSVFDYLTFGTLLMLGAPAPLFRTAWFIESVLSEVFMLLVLRTWKRFWQSRVGDALVVASVLVPVATVLLPYTRLAEALGFAALSESYLLMVATILAAYIGASEVAKGIYRRKSMV